MAGWWDRKVVPQIIRLGCGCQKLAELRQPIVSQASGKVLELGIGAGANLRWYDTARVESVTGIEPSPELRAMAAAAHRPQNPALDILDGAAEALPFADATFDTVVCTFTLCTVHDHVKAVHEARRVLRPGGKLLFCEHGLSPDAGVQRWQRRIDPLWASAFGGCHITRPVRETIARAFNIAEWKGGYQPGGMKLAAWMESGVATAS
ncbi:MAG TPA: class I SAM-dependent methyltransferase [Novosphingobium sp.]|nr:class I SAM-dependent methyltransferase [Novosphingobium sp.]